MSVNCRSECFGQRHRQPRQLVTRQVALPLDLGIALDALGRIVGAHLPADGEGEHLGEHGDDAIGGIGATGLRDVLVQLVDVSES